jgi:hypothetical protein
MKGEGPQTGVEMKNSGSSNHTFNCIKSKRNVQKPIAIFYPEIANIEAGFSEQRRQRAGDTDRHLNDES